MGRDPVSAADALAEIDRALVENDRVPGLGVAARVERLLSTAVHGMCSTVLPVGVWDNEDACLLAERSVEAQLQRAREACGYPCTGCATASAVDVLHWPYPDATVGPPAVFVDEGDWVRRYTVCHFVAGGDAVFDAVPGFDYWAVEEHRAADGR